MISWEYPPAVAGGMAAHVDGLAHALATAGHDVVVLTCAHAGVDHDTVIGGVRVVRAEVDMPWLDAGELARTASGNHRLVSRATALAPWRPDVVHAHDWRASWAGDVLAAIHDVPLVTTLHGTERSRHGGHLPPGPSTDINAVEWWTAFRSDRLVTSTRLMAREIVSGFELDPSNVHRIPNGIDPAWWRSDGPDDHSETIRSGRDADAADGPLVLAWGRVQYEKGFQVLARAMSTLRQRLPGVRCTIAGRGSFLPELQSQVDIEGVSDIVELPGFVSDPQLRSLIHRASCVAIPSLYEPFGVVALEAMAGGAPLVVADTGGLAELVGGTGSALLFEPGNADELAERIERVVTDDALAADLRRRGADLLEATYTWDAIATRTLDVYEGAARERRGG